MMRRSRTATGLSRIPARLLVLVLCTAAASASVQVLQRPGRAVAGPLPNTATPTDTPTNTPVPNTNTPTDTPTNTQGPNTNTPTSTPTNTQGPNTDTPTNTPSPSSTATVTPTITPTAEVGNGLCSDGLDNNLNGLIDCFDPSCSSASICAAGAPAMSPVLLLLATAGLTLIGLLQLRRYLR